MDPRATATFDLYMLHFFLEAAMHWRRRYILSEGTIKCPFGGTTSNPSYLVYALEALDNAAISMRALMRTIQI